MTEESDTSRRTLLGGAASLGSGFLTAGCLRLQASDTGTTESGSPETGNREQTNSDDSTEGSETDRDGEDDGTNDGTDDETTTDREFPSGAFETDWHGFRRGDGNAAAAPEASFRGSSAAVAFSEDVSGNGGIALRDGTLYVVGAESVIALRTRDRELIWRYDVGASVVHPPEVTDDVVIVPDKSGVVHGIARDDGSRQWAFDDFRREGQFPSAPVTARDGMAFFGIVTDGVEYDLYGIDTATGEAVWIKDHPDKTQTAPAVGDDLAFILDYGGRLAGYDRMSGEQVWEVRVRNSMTTPVLADDSLFVAGETLQAYDPATGDQQWETVANAAAEPAVTDGTVFVPTTTGYVLAVDAADGSVSWEADLDRGPGPTVVAGNLVCTAVEGELVGLDTGSGSETVRVDLGENTPADPPVVTDHAILFTTEGGTLVGISG